MGMFKLFSSDSRDNSGCLTGVGVGMVNVQQPTIIRVNSTSDPTKFLITKQIVVNGYPIFLVNYQDVKNYEGNKILMYPKNFNLGILKYRMDPHFFDKGDSPIARFEPTTYGWKLAQTLAKSLNGIY